MTVPTPRAVNPRRYTDLRLELRDLNAGTGRYVVSLSGALGDFDGTARLVEDELADPLAELADGGIEEDEDRIAFGQALADRLLPDGGIRTQVTEAIRRAGPGTGVRLRLVTKEPRLAGLPWEYTYLSLLNREDPDDFLVLNPMMSLVRHEQLPLPLRELHAAEADLRLLAVTANAPGYPQLDLERERRALETALARLPPDLPRLTYEPVVADPTATELQAALVVGADLFHFAGHGGVHGSTGYLALPPADGGQVEFGTGRLGKLLQSAGVRLAVLGACDSGRRGRSQWAGVVPGLVAGAAIPAVVAMQYPVRNSAAVTFASAFYTAVAAGLSVDEAVWSGRIALLDPDDLSASWGIPVLYLRSSDGVLFPRLAERPSSTAETVRSIVDLQVQSVQSRVVTGIDAADLDGLGMARTSQVGRADQGGKSTDACYEPTRTADEQTADVLAAFAQSPSFETVTRALETVNNLNGLAGGIATVQGGTDDLAGDTLSMRVRFLWGTSPSVSEPALLIQAVSQVNERYYFNHPELQRDLEIIGNDDWLYAETFWEPGQPPDNVGSRLITGLMRESAFQGKKTLDWDKALAELARTLGVVLASRRGEARWPIAPLFELVSDDWAITTAGAEYRTERWPVFFPEQFPSWGSGERTDGHIGELSWRPLEVPAGIPPPGDQLWSRASAYLPLRDIRTAPTGWSPVTDSGTLISVEKERIKGSQQKDAHEKQVRNMEPDMNEPERGAFEGAPGGTRQHATRSPTPWQALRASRSWHPALNGIEDVLVAQITEPSTIVVIIERAGMNPGIMPRGSGSAAILWHGVLRHAWMERREEKVCEILREANNVEPSLELQGLIDTYCSRR